MLERAPDDKVTDPVLPADALLLAAIHGLDVAIAVQDADGRVLAHNEALERLLGLPSAEIVGFRPLELAVLITLVDGSALDPAHLPTAADLAHDPAGNTQTVWLHRRDGERRRVRARAFALAGPPVAGGAVAVLADVTGADGAPDGWSDAEERFRILADNAPVGIFITAPDGTSLYGNRQAEINTGRPWAEIRRLGWTEFVHPDDLDGMSHDIAKAMADDTEWVTEYRLVRPDGSTPWVRSRGRQITSSDGTPLGIIGTVTDITEVHDAYQQLAESERRLQAVIDSAAEGIVSTDADGIITTFNPAAEHIFGHAAARAIGALSFLDLLAPATREQMRGLWNAFLEGAPARVVGAGPREVVGLTADGREVPIEVVITELDARGGRIFTGIIRDLTHHKALTAELEHRATHDDLTGLPNRSLVEAQLDMALAGASRRRSRLAVLSVLLDRVALVSQALGHDAADALLTEAAARLSSTVGDGAVCGRSAHDQFVVVLEDLEGPGDAVEVAQRVIEAINRPFVLAGEEAFAAAFVGIAVSEQGAGTPASLLADAGVAMRRAVESSATRFEIFDPDMRASVEEHRRREVALRYALQRAEFELYYQPVVDLDTQRPIGAEALVRWHRPDHGIVPPDTFIPIAEDSGLIVDLGAWIIDDAFAQLARWWRELGPACPSLSINLSGRQLAHPKLVDSVRGALSVHAVDPALVSFEITESVLLRDVDRAVAVLDELRDLGVSICLDDFGTGYSSLTYLCRFPVDVVKIDRSFVSGDGRVNEPIVTMILGLANTLGLEVVAEGVETEEQAERLRLLGCPKAQGFLFARPAPPADWPVAD